MDHEKINEPTDPLEQQLRQFTPRGNTVDRDWLMFLAGKTARESELPRSALRGASLWPVATFAMTGLAACFAIALGLQLLQPPRERIVVREAPVTAPQNEHHVAAPAMPVIPNASASPVAFSLPASSLLQMRNVALRFGVEALPAEQTTSSSTSQPMSAIDSWQQLRAVDAKSDSSL